MTRVFSPTTREPDFPSHAVVTESKRQLGYILKTQKNTHLWIKNLTVGVFFGFFPKNDFSKKIWLSPFFIFTFFHINPISSFWGKVITDCLTSAWLTVMISWDPFSPKGRDPIDKHLTIINCFYYIKCMTAIVLCSKSIWITNFSDHRRVWTPNLLHTK